jgi:hypothetical protein
VFVIADLMGIELDRMWNRILQIMNDEYKRDITVWNMIHIASHDSGVVSRRREQEEEARKFLTDHFPDMEWIDMDFFDAEDERYQILDGVKNLIEGTFDEIGAGTEALFRDRQFVLFYNAYKAMCSSVRKMDEEDLEQITLLAVIRYLSAALARLITIHNSELNELLRIEFRDVVDPEEIRELTDHRLTDGDLKAVRMAMQGGSVELLAGDERSGKLVRSLESIRQRGQGKETIKKQKKQEQILLVEVDEKDERIRLLEEELAERRRQLAVAQNDIRAQRSLYEEQREYSDVLKRQAEERRKEHAELLTLRQFDHQLDSPDISEDKIPDSDKIERLRKHKIAIVGGHENWIKKMRRILPEWTYIGASDSISVDSAVTSVEKIYFYTDIMSHKMYYKFMKAAQDNKRPFGYLHGTNISGIVNALYEELPGQ